MRGARKEMRPETGIKVGAQKSALSFQATPDAATTTQNATGKHQRVSASSLSVCVRVCVRVLRALSVPFGLAVGKIMLLSRYETIMEQEQVLKSTLMPFPSNFPLDFPSHTHSTGKAIVFGAVFVALSLSCGSAQLVRTANNFESYNSCWQLTRHWCQSSIRIQLCPFSQFSLRSI